jgi:hypothetical protein
MRTGADRQARITKLIVIFRNFAKAPKYTLTSNVFYDPGATLCHTCTEQALYMTQSKVQTKWCFVLQSTSQYKPACRS